MQSITGTTPKPAIIGPAIASGTFTDIWLYIVGPVVGGILAALLYNPRLRDPA